MISDKTKKLEVIEKLLNLNSSIEQNLFKKTKFMDHELEKEFLQEENNIDESLKIKSDLLIIFGWFSILIYISVAFYKLLYIISCSIMTFISLLLSSLRYFNKERKFKLIIDHIQVFMIVIYLNLKSLYVIYYLTNENDDHDEELIRTITYNWVATTFLYIQKLDGRPWVFMCFTIMNFSTILIIQFYSFNNHFYYLDGISSLIAGFGAYVFKKYSDVKIRICFGEKIKNKKMSNFFLGFINSLNGFYLNFINDKTISYGTKMENEMESLKLFEYDNQRENNSMKFNKNEEEQFIFLNSSTESDIYKFLNFLKLYQKKFFLQDSSYSFVNNVQNESLFNIIKKLQTEITSNPNFINIGIYFINTPNGYRYYDVFYRKINVTETNIIYDLVFYKATDLINSLIKIEEETQHKNLILAKLVHEFKTPLNSILGLIDNIKERKETNVMSSRHDLNIIKNLSNYVIFLINDIIHYSSRKNYDELNIIMNEIDIRNVVFFTFEILNSLLSCNFSKCQSIITELEFEDDLYNLTVYADETRLKQILLNLISNAVKFTKSGFIIIRCIKHKENDSILLSVADSGLGIRDENQQYIFNDYFMESVEYNNNTQGTGIGLSICKNLAKRMNMEIKFTSKLGKGTEFTIEIPTKEIRDKNYNKIISRFSERNDSGINHDSLSIDEISIGFLNKSICISSNYSINVKKRIYHKYLKQIKDNHNYKSHTTNSLNRNELEYQIKISKNLSSSTNDKQNNIEYSNSNEIKRKINSNIIDLQFLIVDDDMYICNSIKILIKKIFNDVNYLVDIITASDGVHIIQKVIEDQRNGNKIKCIITDENMEYLNGSDAIKIIRNLEKESKIKNIKIITATSQENIQIVNYIKSIGADIVMSKPLSKSVLTKALQDLKIIN